MLLSSDTDGASGLTPRGRLKFLLRDSALYGGSAAISKAFGFVTFPILVRHFSAAEYGLLDYFLTLASLLVVLLSFGQDSAVARFFFEYTDRDARRQLISQSLLVQIAAVVLVAPIFWLLADHISSALLPSEQVIHTSELLRLVVLQVPFLLLINFSQNILKWTFDRARFLTISLGLTTLQASGILVAVLVFDAGIREVLVVCLVTSAVFGTFGLLFVSKWLVWPRSINYLRELLPFAMPLGLICVAGAIAPTLERTLAVRLLGANDLGLYAAGTKVAMIVGLLDGAFQTAWGPFSLSIYRQPDAAHTYNQVLRLFSLGICMFVLLLSLFAGLIVQVLAPDQYQGASVVVFPLAMGFAIQATSWITDIGIGLSKRSYLNLFPYAVSLGVLLVAIWILAPVLGLFGVALGVLLGHLSKAVMASWLAQRAYPLPWCYEPVILLIMSTTAVGLSATWLGQIFGEGIHEYILATSLPVIGFTGWKLLFTARGRSVLD